MVGSHITRKLPDLSQQNKLPFGFGDRFYQEIIEDSGVPTHIAEKLLETSLDEFMFSARLSNALLRHELKTIGDVLNVGWSNVNRFKNVGRKSIEELRNTIENYVETNSMLEKEATETKDHSKENTSFVSVIEIILSSSLTEKQLKIIKARYGYENGKKKTLDKIGKAFGITRERVRQIIVKSHKQLKHPLRKKYFQEILEHIEYSLLHNKGVVSDSDLSADSFFSSSSENQLRFLINLIADLYDERYRIIEKRFLTSLNDEALKELNSTIEEASFKCQ